MSMPNKTNVNCPHCGALFTTTVWSSVNTDLSKDLPAKIISGEFFDARCPQCGFVAHMEYDLLYHDMKHSAMIWVVHEQDSNNGSKIDEIKRSAILPGYQTRIVRDMNALREKVAALESGKDDRIIELCKVFIKYEVLRQNPEFSPRNAFYTFAGGKDLIFVYCVDGDELHCALEGTLYDNIKAIFEKAFMSKRENPYEIYDETWADSFFGEMGDIDIPLNTTDNLVDVSVEESHDEPSDTIPGTIAYLMLRNNPFYILGVTCSDSRRAIMSASEEMSFLNDAEICSDAAAVLTTPAKRLSAEIDWFVDLPDDSLQIIRGCIDDKQLIPTDGLTSLSRLNASLFNLALSNDSDYFEVGYSILDIDEQYSNISIDSLTDTINQRRAKAKLPEATTQDVSTELEKKRVSIRQIITENLSSLDEGSYIELVTMLAEKCIADETYDDGVILSDVIDQYEIRMQAEIEDSTTEIEAHIERIKHLSLDDAISSNINALIKSVKQWDTLVQPLQLRSMESGMPHENSVEVGHEIRNLALYLHNEKSKTEDALVLVNAMKEVFSELNDLLDYFNADSKALEDLIADDREAKEVLAEMDAIKKDGEKLKATATSITVDAFVAKIGKLNKRIKRLSIDAELRSKIRESLCYMARETAIELHNSRQQTSLALTIAKALQRQFSDVPSLNAKLAEDVSTLNQQLVLQNVAQTRRAQQESAQKSKNIGCLVVIGIIVLIVIISAIANSGGSGSNSSHGASTYSAGETTTPETKFSSSSTSGSKVYADIVSIWPAIGIYTEGSSNYSSFVCECKTSTGSTVWVYMSVTEYHNNFDSSASTSVYSSYADEVTYTASKRIHGTVKKADNVMSGLSSDTGTLVIDFSSLD